MYSKVQYISQGNTAEEQFQNIQSVLDAGYTWIQLRFKNQEENTIATLAEKVKILCNKYNAIFIINDNVQIAKSVGASGIHLGLSDMGIVDAKAILGEGKIIGGTANTLKDVLQRIEEGCSYIGLGPFRFTQTKEKLSPILGLEGYQMILNALDETQKRTPIYAIGGIMEADIKAILEIGIYGIAASGMLTQSIF